MGENLDTTALRALGIPEPWTFGRADQVRFSELDPLSHVNNAVYLSWFEATRIHWFFDRGVSTYSEGDPRLVLRAVSVDYLAELRLHDRYVITCRASTLGRTSFTTEYALFSKGHLKATGTAVVVLLDPGTGQKMPLPEGIKKTLVEKDGAQPSG